MNTKETPLYAEDIERLCGIVAIRLWQTVDGRWHVAIEGRGVPENARYDAETRLEALKWAEQYIDAFLAP